VDEDRQWVEKSQQGDEKAFESLVRRYYEPAVRLAYGVVRNEEEAVDVVQAAMLKAWQGLDRFSGKSKFSTWLYRIVVNQAIDRRRKLQRKAAESLDQADEEGLVRQLPQDLLPDSEDSPRLSAEEAELAAQLDKALESISGEHREVFILREIQGLSYEEIAEVAGCPVGTVMSRLYNARQALREKLEHWLPEERES
jgi:RNA polymerase sigma-70 factor, ECF subfamily